jgi:hypothetical protein
MDAGFRTWDATVVVQRIDPETLRLIEVGLEVNSLQVEIEDAERRLAALLDELKRLAGKVSQTSSEAQPKAEDEDEESEDAEDASAEDADDADADPAGVSVTERVRLYFVAHPTAIMSASDLMAAGVQGKIKALRQALMRLTERKILFRHGKGQYALAPTHRLSAA